jgi:hypothetical protein
MEEKFLFAEFLSSPLPDDPEEAGLKVTEKSLKQLQDPATKDECYDVLALMRALAPKYGWDLQEDHFGVSNVGEYAEPEYESIYVSDLPQKGGGLSDHLIVKAVIDFVEDHHKQFTNRVSNRAYAKSLERYKQLTGTSPYYELSEGDIAKIQELINKLRVALQYSEILTGEHRQRMLSRLEKIQSELHKRVSDFDRFYGMITDCIVLAGQFGEKALKPITELVREIYKLVWITQCRSLNLPSDTPLPLPSGSDSKGD